MFCTECGSRLNDAGFCLNCSTTVMTTQSPSKFASNSDWASQMMRWLILVQSFAALMFFFNWPIILMSGEEVAPPTSLFFVTLLVGIGVSVAEAFLLRGSALFLAFLISGQLLWVLPEIVSHFSAMATYNMSLDFPSLWTFDELSNVLAGATVLGSDLYPALTGIGFYLLSLAYWPFVLIAVISLAHSSIAKDASQLAQSKSAGSNSTPILVAAGFIAAFLAPLAGLVLAIVSLAKWKELTSQLRGVAIAALAVSVVSLFANAAFWTLVIGPAVFGLLGSF